MCESAWAARGVAKGWPSVQRWCRERGCGVAGEGRIARRGCGCPARWSSSTSRPGRRPIRRRNEPRRPSGGVTHLSRHLRVELGAKKVRVSAIEPGIVGIELQSHVRDEGARAWLEGSKEAMEWLAPEDIARTVGFVASLPPRANRQQVTIMPTAQAS
ncbi:SDR family oxidoreductase [Streptomyces sp. NPDC050549]|uniref:SDR family oxidoreductase n=1 Tax=Streptomyces sp. NPDC050549 TaxID=3155406 RepID=UPI00341A37C5